MIIEIYYIIPAVCVFCLGYILNNGIFVIKLQKESDNEDKFSNVQ